MSRIIKYVIDENIWAYFLKENELNKIKPYINIHDTQRINKCVLFIFVRSSLLS